MDKLIIAIDPSGNGTTGIFTTILDNDLKCTYVDWISIKYSNDTDLKKYLIETIGKNTDYEIHIVIEDYKDRGITRDSSTAKVISFIQETVKQHCEQFKHNLAKIKLQQPSIKALVTNKYLIGNNLVRRSTWCYTINLKTFINERSNNHVLDALRHWVYYCNKTFYHRRIDYRYVFNELFIK